MKYFDIHSHLNLSPLSERKEEIIKTLEEKEIGTITVGTDFENSAQAVAIAIESDNLFVSVGLHPTEVMEKHFDLEEFRNLASKNKVVAIGECGLDYFRIDANDGTTKNLQKEIFNKQIDLAIEKNLPLILHVRPQKGTMDAYEDVLDILESRADQNIRGDVHFFVGTPEIAERFLKLGFYLSFTGVITFARDYDEVIRQTPIDRILTETDATSMSPSLPSIFHSSKPMCGVMG
jgi:TatD DNase family protein